LLDDPIVNFSQSIVDDSIDKNAKFQSKVGLRPIIKRRTFGHACEWCRNLAGTYEYRDAPDDIYRRHQRCRCTVEYDPGNGRMQDVWSKNWIGPDKDAKIEARKKISGKRNNDDSIEMLNPVYKMERIRRGDYDSYEEWAAAKDKVQANRRKRNEWLDSESARFYSLRSRNVKSAESIIDGIQKLGFSTKGLGDLDPVALDSIGRGIEAIKKKYPNFIEYLKDNDGMGFSLKAAKAKDYHELMAHTGSGIEINTDKFTSKPGMKDVIREFLDDKTEVPGNNFHAISDEFTHIIVHEFGHAFEDYARNEYGYLNLWESINNELVKKNISQLPFVSEYAETNRSEWFAEIFGQSVVGKQDKNVDIFNNAIKNLMKGK